MRSFYIFLIILLFSSCINHNNKIIRKKSDDGEIFEGNALNDSIFNGIVNIYDVDNNYLGYTNYKYGIENGVCVKYFHNGKISDSMFYRNGSKNGFAYAFDSLNG